MSIYLVTGKPGSAKSYYAVNQIKSIIDSNENCIILTNIEGLKVDDERLLLMDFSQDGFANTKQKTYLEQLRKKYNLSDSDKIYYFIDEAQQFFSPRLKNDEVIYFFDKHRHYGIDIYLISQNIKKMHRDITVLGEYEIRASSASLNPLPGFFYRKYVDNEQFASFRLQKSNEIFGLYKSMDAGNPQKKNKKYLYFMIVLAVVICCSVYAFSQTSVVNSSTARTTQNLAKNKESNISSNKDSSKSSDSINDDSSSSKPEVNMPIFKADSIEQAKENIPALPNNLPNIVSYNKHKDALKVDPESPGKYFIDISKFLKKYKPFLSGFSYYHVPNHSFVILSKNCDKVLFPKDSILPHRKVMASSDNKEEKKEEKGSGGEESKMDRAAIHGVLGSMSLDRQVLRYGAQEVAEFYGVTLQYLQSETDFKIDTISAGGNTDEQTQRRGSRPADATSPKRSAVKSPQ